MLAVGMLAAFSWPLSVASADDGWNPFAAKDRAAARRRAVERERSQRPDERRPYLDPMDAGDVGRYGTAPPQPYPAAPPGYGNNGAYQPPGAEGGSGPGRPYDTANGQRPSGGYGEPGTYAPSPTPGANGFGAAPVSVELHLGYPTAPLEVEARDRSALKG